MLTSRLAPESAQISPEDQYVLECVLGYHGAYEALVSDRNDAAIMHARTQLAQVGCPATRDRVMPA
jgi:seryl-tRNA(Sec) selenium transferase